MTKHLLRHYQANLLLHFRTGFAPSFQGDFDSCDGGRTARLDHAFITLKPWRSAAEKALIETYEIELRAFGAIDKGRGKQQASRCAVHALILRSL